MRLSPPDLASLQHICRNLRERDRLELEATEENFDPDEIANRLLTSWRVCGLIGQIASIDNEPVSFLGVIRYTPTAGSAGLLATDRWREIASQYSRHVRRWVLPKLVELGMRRVEARTWEHHDDSRRWLKWLGATEECRVPHWGRNDETFIQYVWIPDVHLRKVAEVAGAGSEPATLDHRHIERAAG